jgi:hypothetical protein
MTDLEDEGMTRDEGMTQGDSEISAMQAVVAALQDLDEDQRRRVLEWTAKRFDVQTATSRRRTTPGQTPDDGDEAQSADFEDFADLLDAANPAIEDDRALVGAYWYQVVGRSQTFTGGQVNDALKDTGQGVSNITRTLDNLQRRSPALVRQVSKSGRSKQARKTYKLTVPGIRAVQAMIRGEAGDAGDGDDEA